MGSRRRGGLQVVVCLALTVLSLWPVAPVERMLSMLAWGTWPVLLVGRPLWGVGHSFAADDEHQARWEREAEESAFLEDWVREQAVPRSVSSASGVALHAEAVGRPEGKLDSLLVRVWHPGIVRVGMPVTTGDHYVGLVERVRLRQGPEGPFEDVSVQLITSGQARIQASLMDRGAEGEDGRFVVGGLLAPEDFELGPEREVLAVHHPSNRKLEGGEVFVNEPLDGGRDAAWLANGFRLGTLRRAPKPEEATRETLLGVLPGVDFESGLYQVLIHTGWTREELGPVHDEEVQRGRWVTIQRAPYVDGAPWREGFKLIQGARAGVQVGAAVAHGVRIVGRVTSVGPWHADVVGPGDSDFAVPGIAVWLHEGADSATFVMGRLRSLGRDAEGRVLLRWPATLAAPAGEPVRARLYTGSGDPGVPRGLLLGEAEIPVGPGPHVLVLEPPADSDVWTELRVFAFEEALR